MKQLFRVLTVTALIAALTFSPGCIFIDDDVLNSDGSVNNTNYTASETFSMSLTANGKSLITVTGVNGDVHIIGSASADSVIVDGIKMVSSESQADAREHMEELGIGLIHLSDEIRISTQQPQETHGRLYTVNYTIIVPEDFQVNVENVNGSVTVENILNYVEADNVNGAIDFTDIQGSVQANLVNGQITAKVILPENGDVDLQTVNGNIVLQVPVSVSVDLRADVVVGSITISGLTVTDVTSTMTSYRCTIGTGRGDIDLETVNGNITVSGF